MALLGEKDRHKFRTGDQETGSKDIFLDQTGVDTVDAGITALKTATAQKPEDTLGDGNPGAKGSSLRRDPQGREISQRSGTAGPTTLPEIRTRSRQWCQDNLWRHSG